MRFLFILRTAFAVDDDDDDEDDWVTVLSVRLFLVHLLIIPLGEMNVQRYLPIKSSYHKPTLHFFSQIIRNATPQFRH